VRYIARLVAIDQIASARMPGRRLEESQCADRRHERDEEEHAEDTRAFLIQSHP
jgi:hypothetical protein